MSLSKIYRGVEAQSLKAFQFLSFGADELAPSEPGAGRRRPGEGGTLITSPPAIAGHSAQEVEEAYARGFKEGLGHAGQQLESAAQALAGALEEVSRLRETLARNSRQDMLRLVMAVAEQVIREQAAVDSGVVLKIIENALGESVRSDHYRIRINPVDLAAVTEQKPLFLASISGLKNLHIEADAGISAGGCRVDSEFGAVDATLETQLDAIRQALHEALTDS